MKYFFCLIILLNLNTFITAQCEEHTIAEYQIAVKDRKGNKIPNPKFSLVNYKTNKRNAKDIKFERFLNDSYLLKWNGKDFEEHSNYLINSTFYSVEVSADGYEPSVENIKLYRCRSNYSEVVLRKLTDNTTIMSGIVTDSYGARIPGAEIMAERDKKKFKAISDDEGAFKLQLDEGSYKFEVKAVGFEDFKLSKINVATKYINSMKLDIVLEVKDIEPCGYEGICL